MATTAKPTTKTKSLGVIRADEAYRLDEFASRSGLGKWGLRMLRRQGLRMVKIGGRSWVRGEDFFAFLAEQAAKESNDD